MPRLTIHLLGPFQATLDNERVNSFETEKVRALLAYLATEIDRPQRREFLAELFWPDRPEGAARANLRHALGNLRTVVGDRVRSGKPAAAHPFLLVTRDTIQLNPEGDAWVDTDAFERLLQGPTPSVHLPVAKLQAAASLYRGDFIEDIAVADSAAFHEWVLLKREAYRRQALNLLYRLTECYRAKGEYERALKCAWRRMELAPWDETAHQHVMRLLAYTGQRTAALAQFESCRQLLADALTPVMAYQRLANPVGFAPASHAFLLESVVGGERIARYSFVAADPEAVFTASREKMTIREKLEIYYAASVIRSNYFLIATIISLVGLALTAEQFYVIYYTITLVAFSMTYPTIYRINRQLRLNREEREVIISRKEIK